VGVGVGVGVCTYEPELCVPPPPPPPPPPPQDCYAVKECSPPSPPDSLKNDQYEPDKPTETTKPRDIPSKDTIIGTPPDEAQLLQQLGDDGINGIDNVYDQNGLEPSAGAGDEGLTTDPGNDVGKPATPGPSGPETGSPESGSPAADAGSGGSAGSGGGGGNPAPPAAPEPPEPGGPGAGEAPSAPRFTVGSDGAVVPTISPTNVLGPGESVPPGGLNIGMPGEDGVYNISPAQSSSSGSLDLSNQADEVNRLNNPNVPYRPDPSQLNANADDQLNFSHIKDTTDAIGRAQEGFGRGASKTSAWVRLVNELLNFIHNYPRW
jgi:hypothetical protein